MGDQRVSPPDDAQALHRFSKALLEDIAALEQLMLDNRLERGVTRLGFEQECFLVDAAGRPAPVADAVLGTLQDRAVTHEIARYNLELNLEPLHATAGCLHRLEHELNTGLGRMRTAAARHGADILLAGVLPSLTEADLTLDNLTDAPRYHALNARLVALAGGHIRTAIHGQDSLDTQLDSIMLESCNTSVQIHLQVDPDRLPAIYNATQLASAPVLAAAANSPLLLQRRLWQESRIPSFEQSIDFRSPSDRARGSWQRVHFGESWVRDSILEVYRDQVARHRILVVSDVEESSLTQLARGETPTLRALALHNGSLYRWNRLCYGVADGVPHVRIEHRPLPAGPTVLDEVANTALFVGLTFGLDAEHERISERFHFASVRANFLAAARDGLDAVFRWHGGAAMSARSLLLDTLLPQAYAGLATLGVSHEEAARYLQIIEARVVGGQTGARWTLEAFGTVSQVPTATSRSQVVTRAISSRQWEGVPVHHWSPLAQSEGDDWAHHAGCVQEIMTTDLFAVREDDLVDVAANVMEWKHIRHVPVQDDAGRLVGLLSHRSLLRAYSSSPSSPVHAAASHPVSVREIMDTDVTTTTPSTTCHEAIGLMARRRIGCLPVVRDGLLVGMVSERDFLPFAGHWFRARGQSATGSAPPARSTPPTGHADASHRDTPEPG